MKFKKTNFYNGYKGYKGTTLDQTECELYDDIPAENIEELTLKVLAGGQIADQRRRAAYYDTDNPEAQPSDIEEIDAGTSAEEFDYVTAYKQFKARKIQLWKMSHPETEPQEQEEPKKKPKEEPQKAPENET